jgi:hypothetical protein
MTREEKNHIKLKVVVFLLIFMITALIINNL